MNKDYSEALELYSKAIEELPTEPAFYTNSKYLIFLSLYLLNQELQSTLLCKNSTMLSQIVIKPWSLTKLLLK